MGVSQAFFDMPFGTHLIIATIIRLFLVIYSNYHDQTYLVQYTDVDYRVFTDAARHVLNNESPYARHTYRYTPLLALMLIPNVLLNENFGKILFSLIDILVGIAIKKLVTHSKFSKICRTGKPVSMKSIEKIGSYSAQLWLYNPFAIVIATRGNADSIASFLIIISLLFHQTDVMKGVKKYYVAGIFLGVAIHFRLYPIVFSLPMYIALGDYKITRRSNIFRDMYQLVPNFAQLNLFCGCVATLLALTYVFWLIYGYEFLFESYIYHIIRRDTRHNFSLFFYLQYLSPDKDTSNYYRVIPMLFLLSYFAIRYGRKNQLPFALVTQAITLVAYNSVLTSQYFIWFLSLLPICFSEFEMSKRKASLIFIQWMGTQAGWLFCAYVLEFQGKNVFFILWWQSLALFCATLYMLVSLVRSYNPAKLIL